MDDRLAFLPKTHCCRPRAYSIVPIRDAATDKGEVARFTPCELERKTDTPVHVMTGRGKEIRKRAVLRGGFCYACRKYPICRTGH